MRQDGSWHRLRARIDYAGKSYREQDGLYLGSKLWRELTFAIQPPPTDQRFQGVWPMRDVGGGSNVSTARQMFVAIDVVPLGRVSATLAKWTQSYRDAWYADQNWPRYIANSVLLVVMNVLGQIFACSMAAFALSRLRWPGRELAFGVVLATVMLPAMILLVPQFLIFRWLGWYDTLLPLWVPAFAGTPFFIFMLRQFMLSVPKDLEEAARMDGCSWWGIYWRIMLPLMRPALAAVAIFTFMGTWNEFMSPLIYLSDTRLYPLPLGLYNFSIKNATFFNMLMAASALMTLPAIALFLSAQRYFIEGVTLTGMKG
jgi:multiple sugar transport system permease protein